MRAATDDPVSQPHDNHTADRVADRHRKAGCDPVVRAAEKGTAIVECMKPGPVSCRIAPACFLEPAIREAQEAFYASLDRKSLADITGNRHHLQKLLQIGEPAG
jgi:hypothetical protein